MKLFNRVKGRDFFVLLCFTFSQLISGFYVYSQINNRSEDVPKTSNSIEQWIKHLGAGDSGAYLRVAKNIVDGHGVSDFCKECSPPSFTPFYFWGPGTPLYLALGLKLFGSDRAESLFYMFCLTNFIGGLILLGTAYLFIKFTISRALIACIISYIPPIHEHIYVNLFAASELACFIPFCLFYYFLFKIYVSSRFDVENTKAININGLSDRKSFLYFFAGLSLGVVALIRESNLMFGYFFTVIIIVHTFFTKSESHKWKLVTKYALFFLLGLVLVISPVKLWNKHRINESIISSSSSTALWRYGLWSKHDAVDWYVTSGIGFGEYLDADVAKKVEAAYQRGEGSSLLSMKEFIKVVLKKPLDALKFKLARVPVLWFGTVQWPHSQFTLMSFYCLFFLGSLFIYISLMLYRRKKLFLPLYVYALFIFIASVLIHSEFRYTQPVWYTLIFVPFLLGEELIAHESADSTGVTRELK